MFKYIKYISNNKEEDLTVGLTVLPANTQKLLLEFATGLFVNKAADLYRYLGNNSISFYNTDGEEITDRDDKFFQDLMDFIVYYKSMDFRALESDTKEEYFAAKTYLKETGWYIERLNDPSSGKEVPEEVLFLRFEARKILSS